MNQAERGRRAALAGRTWREPASVKGCAAVGADGREELVAGNEAVFRRINEAIQRGRWPGEDGGAFRCECARSGCAELLDLSQEQYEAVRAHPRRFVVAAGHEDAGVEDVVERRPRHVVVEKRGQAGQIAEDTDPRS